MFLSLAGPLGAGCVTPSQPGAGRTMTPTTPPTTTTPPPRPTEATPPGPGTVQPPLPVETAEPKKPPEGPPGPRLPWVNPARCLASCAAVPGSPLLRVNERAEPDAKGKHRVTKEALSALRELLAAARAAGHNLRIESAFRSYEEQATLFTNMKEQGRAARPGHSEHQLGTAIDLRLPTGKAIEWLAAQAPEFGFALSYPPGKQRLTGYRPEPWHVRFVGQELARELARAGTTLEEGFRTRPGLGESGSCADCPHPSSRAACGDVDAGGRCEGTVLTWCYDGTLAKVDCAVSGQQCGSREPNGPHDCLPRLVSQSF